MRKIHQLFALTLLCCLAFMKSYGQAVSLELLRNSSGCYEVHMKTDVSLNNVKIGLDISNPCIITIVAPAGTGALISSITPNKLISMISTNGNNSLTTIYPPSFTQSPSLEYINLGCFSYNPVTLAANSDFLLFTFCLSTDACVGNLRLIQGLNSDSQYTYQNQSGPADYVPNSHNITYSLYNYVPIFHVPLLTSESHLNTDEYGGLNYGLGLGNCPSVDLTTTLNSGSGVVGSAISLVVNVKNEGTDASTGSVSETISIPQGLTYNNGGGNGWVCVTSNNVGPTSIQCTNTSTSIAGLGTSSFPISLKASVAGTYNVGVVASGGGETNTLNNAGSGLVTTTGAGSCTIFAGVLLRN